MRLHFRTYGQGRPLIILHGLFGSFDNWHTISTRLASRFRVIAADQRNHGESPHAPEMDFALMAGDLEELMKANGMDQADVLGHSMGGKTAMQFAATYPGRTRRLVVVDIAPKPYPPLHREILDALLGLDLPRFGSRTEIEKALEPQLPDLALRRFLLKNLRRQEDGTHAWKIGLQEINNNYGNLLAGLHWDRPLAQPTLFIKGARSDYILDTDAKAIQGAFADVRIEAIEGAGHWVQADAPEAFSKQVLQFLA
jgi:pimeloyl-ACP methyl ester carboxylesterase